MTDVILFLAFIASSVALGWWIITRQERAARHRCRHAPQIGSTHLERLTKTDPTEPYARFTVAQPGTVLRGPVYDLHIGLREGDR